MWPCTLSCKHSFSQQTLINELKERSLNLAQAGGVNMTPLFVCGEAQQGPGGTASAEVNPDWGVSPGRHLSLIPYLDVTGAEAAPQRGVCPLRGSGAHNTSHVPGLSGPCTDETHSPGGGRPGLVETKHMSPSTPLPELLLEQPGVCEPPVELQAEHGLYV